ncbi:MULTISPECIES: DASH family cryptochrome [unclassified Exiguobacterium]|uniref:DASH family cryptochrome n=1 Tax=unclassified Exiguobacterium TaxID=2644629 RepID=UPI0022DF771A|nr:MULTISPECIES: DASH family cryptochrome [unclassified Exiguobacterium]MBQ6460408.1 DASH family cryptochrome [Exiguobacterium sp.]
MKTIIWYQNDLRVDDHLPLEEALRHDDPIEGHFFISPNQFVENRYGVIPLGNERLHFLKESLEDVAGSLDALGIPFYVHVGHPLEMLDPSDRLLFQRAIGYNERRRENEVIKKWKGTYETFEGFTLFEKEDIPFEKMPFLFTEFRKAVEYDVRPRELISRKATAATREVPFPFSIQEVKQDPRTAFPFKGGELAAKRRLNDYLSVSIRTYKETRNGFGVDDSTKLSSYLANGSLSPRRVFFELEAHERTHGVNESTYWLYFELLWREFFQWVALEQGKKLFRSQGIRSKRKDWRVEADVIEKWRKGETGVDFVDAFMRELNATGWMSNRGRQIVANYFAKELKQDWRYGASYFESKLIDYDVASNWGNWAYQAGVGNDSRDRRFNIERQQFTYDPDRAFRNKWL